MLCQSFKKCRHNHFVAFSFWWFVIILMTILFAAHIVHFTHHVPADIYSLKNLVRLKSASKFSLAKNLWFIVGWPRPSVCGCTKTGRTNAKCTLCSRRVAAVSTIFKRFIELICENWIVVKLLCGVRLGLHLYAHQPANDPAVFRHFGRPPLLLCVRRTINVETFGKLKSHLKLNRFVVKSNESHLNTNWNA